MEKISNLKNFKNVECIILKNNQIHSLLQIAKLEVKI